MGNFVVEKRSGDQLARPAVVDRLLHQRLADAPATAGGKATKPLMPQRLGTVQHLG